MDVSYSKVNHYCSNLYLYVLSHAIIWSYGVNTVIDTLTHHDSVHKWR